jgi:multidrug resistance efflux pump
LLLISFLVKYPETIKGELLVDLTNSPKAVVSKVSGKLTKLLVSDNDEVATGEILAYLESTASYNQVLTLIKNLRTAQKSLSDDSSIYNLFIDQNKYSDLGELQEQYKNFYQAFLQYKMTTGAGVYFRRKNYILSDLKNIDAQRRSLNEQKLLQKSDYQLANDEFKMHQKLKDSQVETQAEFRQQQSKYISRKSPLLQTDQSLLNLSANYIAKQKELTELENSISEDKLTFLQAVNTLLSEAIDWKSKYMLTASESGTVKFIGFIQTNQNLKAGQDVFFINHRKSNFFGELHLPQNNLGKIKIGQKVLIKLRSFPFEQFGMLTGRITYIADLPFKDSSFISKVEFDLTPKFQSHLFRYLKPGMIGDAEVITKDLSIFNRLTQSVIKLAK